MRDGFLSRLLNGLGLPKTELSLQKSRGSSTPGEPIEVDFSQSEIDDLRTSVQSEFSEYLGYPIELEDATTNDGDDVAFRILGAIYLSDTDDQRYREIFWKHQRRIVEAQLRLRGCLWNFDWSGGFPIL